MGMERSFLADICEHPDDDGRRLVFADWLDDTGDHDRAEFIRAQVELARIDPYDDRVPDLQRRERELFVKHGLRWGRPLAKFTTRVEYRRGLVGKMTMQSAKFRSEAGKIFAACPLQELRLMGFRKGMDAFAEMECLHRLRALDVSSVRLGAGRVTTLVSSPHLTGLEELNLGTALMRPSGAFAVINSPHLVGLKSLNLENNHLGQIGVDYLAQSKRLPSLRKLGLARNLLTPDGGRRVGLVERLGQQLESLDLHDNLLRDDGVRHLLAPGHFTRLRSLDLTNNDLTRAGLATIASCPQLTTLAELRVGNLLRTVGGVRDLAESPHLTNLRVLDVTHSGTLGDDEALALTHAAFLPRLRELHLPRLSVKGLRHLFGSPVLAGLYHLELSTDQQMAPRVCAEVAQATHLSRRLTRLDLRFCHVGHAGVVYLAGAAHLSGLCYLGLSFNDLGEEAYRALIDSPHLPHWCKVDLWGNQPAKEATRQALRERFAEAVVPK